ncbi:MAG: hypothetical protein AAGK37_19245 [Pseudomonadota bacterium]
MARKIVWVNDEKTIIETSETPPVTTADIFSERDARLLAGTNIYLPGYGAAIRIVGSQLVEEHLNGLAIVAIGQTLAGSAADTQVWNDSAGTKHTLTWTQILQLHSLAAAWKTDIWEAARTLSEADPLDPDYATSDVWP